MERSIPAAGLWFLIKVFAVFALIIWVRATLPRLRIDQVMGFAWKCMLPLAVINLLITACPGYLFTGYFSMGSRSC